MHAAIESCVTIKHFSTCDMVCPGHKTCNREEGYEGDFFEHAIATDKEQLNLPNNHRIDQNFPLVAFRRLILLFQL
jgi:hypothetical protein